MEGGGGASKEVKVPGEDGVDAVYGEDSSIEDNDMRS